MQVCDVRRGALAEADQHAPLARHVLDAQPRAAPVAPDRAGQRLEHPLGLHAAEAREILDQLSLLERELRRGRQVLQRAAAADAEVRDTRVRCGRRSRAARARRTPRRNCGAVASGAAPRARRAMRPPRTPSCRRCARLPWPRGSGRRCPPLPAAPRSASSVAGPQGAGHAAANSSKCGLPDACSHSRTRPHSRSCSSWVRCPRSSSKRR